MVGLTGAKYLAQHGPPFTDGLMTREGIYTQTLILALIPFVHKLWL